MKKVDSLRVNVIHFTDFQILALAALESLIGIDWQQRWLAYLSSHGYLRHLIDNFVMEDGDLQRILASEPESMRPLYTFESKMVSSFFYYFKIHGIFFTMTGSHSVGF